MEKKKARTRHSGTMPIVKHLRDEGRRLGVQGQSWLKRELVLVFHWLSGYT